MRAAWSRAEGRPRSITVAHLLFGLAPSGPSTSCGNHDPCFAYLVIIDGPSTSSPSESSHKELDDSLERVLAISPKFGEIALMPGTPRCLPDCLLPLLALCLRRRPLVFCCTPPFSFLCDRLNLAVFASAFSFFLSSGRHSIGGKAPRPGDCTLQFSGPGHGPSREEVGDELSGPQR